MASTPSARRRALVTTTALLAAIATPLAWAGPSTQAAPTLGLSPVVAVTPTGGSFVEFTGAADPTSPGRLAVGSIAVGATANDLRCAVSTSIDGGRNWRLDTPFGSGSSVDPWVGYDERGRLHLTCLSDLPATGLLHVTQEGARWGAATVRPDTNSASDKPLLALAGNARPVVCHTRAASIGEPQDVEVWRPPARGLVPLGGTRGTYASCLGISTLADGRIVVVVDRSATGQDVQIGIATSSTGGSTWRPTRYVHSFMAPSAVATRSNYYTRPLPQFPSVAVDARTGTVVFATTIVASPWDFKVFRADAGEGPARAVPLPPPPSPLCSTAARLHPNVRFTPAGVLGLMFVCEPDAKFHAAREIWFTASRDLTHWAAPVQLAAQVAPATNAAPFALASNPFANGVRYSEGGDYWSVIAAGERFLPMWIDYATGQPRIVTRAVDLR